MKEVKLRMKENYKYEIIKDYLIIKNTLDHILIEYLL